MTARLPADVGAAIRHARETAGLSLRQLSHDLVVDQSYLRRLEIGQRLPSSQVAEDLIAALPNLPPDMVAKLRAAAGAPRGRRTR